MGNYKPFLYYLLEEDGRVRQIVNGIVTSLGVRKPLPQTPDGWQDILIGWERNMTRYANIRNFSLPMGFVMDGAHILRHDWLNFNIDRKLFLLIQQFTTEVDATYFREYYKYLYKGELDFSTISDKQGASRVEINIMEGSLQKQMKAHENTSFDIPLDDDAILVHFDGIYLSEKHNFITQPGLMVQSRLVGILKTTQEGTASGLATFTIYKQAVPGDLTTSTQYFLITTQAISDILLEGSFSISDVLGGSVQFKLKSSLGQEFNLTAAVNDEGVYSFSQEFDSAEDERWFLIGQGIGPIDSYQMVETNIKLTYKSRKAPTRVKMFKPLTLYRKLVQKITGSADNAYSDLLATCRFCITSGDAIRGLEGASVKTSLNDFFTAMDTYLMAGMGVQNKKIRLERRAHSFVSANPVPLGAVTGWETTPAIDMAGSSIRIGHKEPQVDDVNGKLDFNGYQIWKTPMLSVTKEVKIVSPYKASPYEMEITRINLEGKTTTDNSNDNDVFVADVNVEAPYSSIPPDPVTLYDLYRPIYTPFSGGPDEESIFNVELSPHRLLLVHGPWIRSWLYNYDGTELELVDFKGNVELIAGDVVEKDPVRVDQLGARMFLPFYFTFSPQVPTDLVDTLETDLYRPFSPEWDNETYTGFLIKAGIAPNTRRTQEFKLLAVPETDPKLLI